MALNCTITVAPFVHLEELSDREEDFIDRAVNPRINSRLGCQCVLQAGSGTIEITLPDQTQFLGE
jgi:2Fe-2S ferredoxin